MYGGDPFGNIFGDIHHQMRRQMHDMDRMMDGMIDPFGMLSRHSMYAGMLSDANPRQQRVPHRDDMALMSPFGGFGGGLFGGIMRQMEEVQSNAIADPNAHVFSHSTMITYDGRNGGQPRIVEKSVRKTGDVKETRESLRHGNVGEKMSIEHTIGDRTHLIEKKRDRDGRIREQQRFVNLDQDEAEEFDREFSSRARNHYGGEPVRMRQAIQGNPRSTSNTSRRGHVASAAIRPQARSGTSSAGAAPIVTVPDDDYDEDQSEHSHSSNKQSGSNTKGPIIREMEEDETESNVAKRRKGLIRRMFKANDE